MLIYRITNNPFHKKRFISTYQSPKNTIPFHPQKQIPLEANNEVKTPNAEAKQQRPNKNKIKKPVPVEQENHSWLMAQVLTGTATFPTTLFHWKGQQWILHNNKSSGRRKETQFRWKKETQFWWKKKKRNFDEVVGREGYLISGNWPLGEWVFPSKNRVTYIKGGRFLFGQKNRPTLSIMYRKLNFSFFMCAVCVWGNEALHVFSFYVL